tara:strand:+ start:145 stop:561 length:417 start_codon:yes stop_codon:yes gene_type:complete
MGSVQKEWLIYFYEAKNHTYSDWLYFLKPGFKHCGGITYNADTDTWIHLEYTHAGIRLSFLDKKELEDMLAYLKYFEVLRCPVKDKWQLLRIKDMTCVSFVMRLIGFHKWWIFTPYQLYCALIKAGYKSFWEQDAKKT